MMIISEFQSFNVSELQMLQKKLINSETLKP